jgi:hypothetical protein
MHPWAAASAAGPLLDELPVPVPPTPQLLAHGDMGLAWLAAETVVHVSGGRTGMQVQLGSGRQLHGIQGNDSQRPPPPSMDGPRTSDRKRSQTQFQGATETHKADKSAEAQSFKQRNRDRLVRHEGMLGTTGTATTRPGRRLHGRAMWGGVRPARRWWIRAA